MKCRGQRGPHAGKAKGIPKVMATVPPGDLCAVAWSRRSEGTRRIAKIKNSRMRWTTSEWVLESIVICEVEFKIGGHKTGFIRGREGQ